MVSGSSSFRTMVVSAVKERVASANCGPSSRSAGSASKAPRIVQMAAATTTAVKMPIP
jgi:hypothetical protein